MQEFERLLEIIRILRAPGGCPWDRKQKVEDYKKYLIEEAYELIEGIDHKNPGMVREELGDLFLILVVISEFFQERKQFDLNDVFTTINEKLVFRHPHVFKKKKIGNAAAVLKYWIQHKAKKKKRKTIADRLPKGAPALFLADLFFREYANTSKKFGRGKREEARLVRVIQDAATALPVARDKAAGMSDLLWAVSRLGYLNHLDLEGLYHARVKAEAAAAPYQK